MSNRLGTLQVPTWFSTRIIQSIGIPGAMLLLIALVLKKSPSSQESPWELYQCEGFTCQKLVTTIAVLEEMIACAVSDSSPRLAKTLIQRRALLGIKRLLCGAIDFNKGYPRFLGKFEAVIIFR